MSGEEPKVRFAVRTRGHGFAVVDLHGLQLDRTYATRAVAARTAKYFNAAENHPVPRRNDEQS